MKNDLKPTFKHFINRIIESENKQDAIENVFYGTIMDNDGHIFAYGIDTAYQHGKITWKEHQTLLAIIEKMA